MGSTVIDRAFFELNSSAPDVEKGFASLLKTMAGTNDTVIRAQQKFQDLANTQSGLTTTIKRLEEEHGRLSQYLESGTTNIRKWAEASDRVAAINKDLIELDKKQAKTKEDLAAAHKRLEQATQQSGTSFQAFGQIVANFIAHPVQTAQQSLEGLLGYLGPTAVGFGAIATAVVGAGIGFEKFVKSSGEAAERIINLSYATGMTVERVQALQRLGEKRQLGDLVTTIERLNVQLGSMEGGDFTEAILKTGIAIKQNADAIYYLQEMRRHYVELTEQIGSNAAAQQAAADLGVRLFKQLGPLVLNTEEDIVRALQKIQDHGAVMSKDQIQNLAGINEKLKDQEDRWIALANVVKVQSSKIVGFLENSGYMRAMRMLGIVPKQEPAGPTPAPSNAGQSGEGSGGETEVAENELRRRARIIAEADAVAAGTRRELIGLTIQLNDLERQYTEERSKEKSLNQFDAERLASLASQIGAVKELIKEIQDYGKAREKAVAEAERAKKTIEDLDRETAQIWDRINAKGHAALVPSDREIDRYLSDLEKKTLARVKTFNDVELALQRQVTDQKIEQLRLEEKIIDTVTPRNAQEREQIEIEKIHLQFAIQAEAERLRYTEKRGDLVEKISKLDPLDPLRQAAERYIANLDQIFNQKLASLADLEAANVLKVHREEYQRMIDTVRDGAGQVFDAIASRGKGAFQNLMDWLEGTFLSGMRVLFQNLVESIATGFKGGFNQLFQGLIPKTSAYGGDQSAIYRSTIPAQYTPGTLYTAGAGGTFAMDYFASLQGGSFVVPDTSNSWKGVPWALPETESNSYLSNLTGGAGGMNWGTFFGGGQNGFFGSEGSPGFLGSGTGGINGQGVGGPLGGMMAGGGMSMFFDSFDEKGAGAWGKSIGGGAMTGFAIGGPWGAAIGAAAGLGVRLAKLAMGKNSYEAGSMEAARDFGGITISEDQFETFLNQYGISESKAYPNRKNILSSPDFLKDYAWAAAQAEGKTDDFLESLENVETAWGSFNFRPAFDVGRLTGDWSALNAVWKETAGLSNMQGIGPEVADKLLIDENVLEPWEQLIVDINDLKKAVQESIPPTKTMWQTFLETGEITQELRDQVNLLGGDLAAFERVSELTQINNDFGDLVEHFRATGEILPDLRQMFIDFGGDLQVLDDAAALPGLRDSLTFIESLTTGLRNLAPELDPIKALLSGQWNVDVMAALTAAGLDPTKFEGLSQLINWEQNWNKIAVPFTKLTPELESALMTYGGAEGQLAVERYYEGLNTITEGLLNTTKAAMDQAYRTEIKSALDYLGDIGDETSAKITALTTAVETQFTIVGKNITDAIGDAKDDLILELDKLILAVAGLGEAATSTPGSSTPESDYQSAHDAWEADYQNVLRKYGPEAADDWEREHPEPQPPVPKAHTGGLIIEAQPGEAVLDPSQTRNLLRSEAGRPIVQLIGCTIFGFQDFVEQVRLAGLELREGADPAWT